MTDNDGTHETAPPAPVVAGAKVTDLLMHVYLDGLTTGLSSGIAMFLPDKEADDAADDYVRQAVANPEVMANFQQTINERVTEMVLAAQEKGPEFTVTGAAAETLIAQLRPASGGA